MPRDKSEERSEFASGLERLCVSNRCDQRCRSEPSDTGDFRDGATGSFLFVTRTDALLEEVNIILNAIDASKLILQIRDYCLRQHVFQLGHTLADFGEACDPTRAKRYAEFIQQPPELIDLHGPELGEQRSHAMQTEHGLLILRLGRHRAHARPLHCCPDRTGVRGVGFVCLYERPDKLGMQQNYFMPQ
ncbi:UNVERIFIED_ORG: hypothetical protein J2Y81_008142 [Paraburkholderia sediminicola]|nr:hypothetical protein [Paraburkholderia sediminicola]